MLVYQRVPFARSLSLVALEDTGRIERDPEKIAVLDLEKIDPSKPLLFKHNTSCSCHYSPHVQ